MGIQTIRKMAAMCLCSALVPATAMATFGPRGPGEKREPPQAAFDACKDKSEGATVTITTPRGDTITATCKKYKEQLVAVPEGAPPQPPTEGDGPR